jgi:glycosyltransferase involved in cell wall biosynthesis
MVKKILYITSTLSRSGPTNQLYSLIKYLNRDKFHPYILTLSPESVETRIHDFEELSVDIQCLKLSRLKGMFLSYKVVKKIIDKIQPDIVHTQGIRADFICAKLNDSSARFATQHNYPSFDYPLKFGYFKGKLMAHSHLKSFKKIPSVIACSKTISKLDINQGLLVDFIQNGVDLDCFSSKITDNKKSELRKSLSISNDVNIFIAVGSLIKRKAFDQLIKAFNEACFARPTKLLILGDGPNRNEYEDLSKNNPDILFIGHVSNVNKYLAISDCFVSSSLAEGLPYTVIEAMASGLPVILSDIDSHEEILEIDPLAGETFPVNSIERLTKCLESFCPSQKASEASLNIVHSRLNARSMSLEYQKTYLRKLAEINGL